MPQFGSRNNRMTVYDLMDARGVFAANPANANAQGPNGEPLYQGPVEFPQMLYHPTGEEQILVPGRVEPTPTGPVHVPPQKIMKTRVVADAAELEEALSAGWHLHPADAIAAGGGVAPAKSAGSKISEMEAQIKHLQRQLAAAGQTGSHKSTSPSSAAKIEPPV